jgi:cell division protein FtsZ
MAIEFGIPDTLNDLRPKILVFGVGGGGGNSVNNMILSQLEGVEFVVANTDAQALAQSLAPNKLQLGAKITTGLGAGSRPEIGKAAAEESAQEILEYLSGSNMVFVTAGMGGGTGSGAAPVVARLAREQGILTVGVVTKPFQFEGQNRMRVAERCITELSQTVDTLIVIANQNLFRVANERTTFAEAFKMADHVLYAGVRGITDLIVMPGLINLDFADIYTVLAGMGRALMGTGEASGERRAIDAAESAISNPLLEDASMKGSKNVIVNVNGGPDMTLFEVDEAVNRIRDEVDPEANIIFGSTFDPHLEGKMRISVVATGIDQPMVQSSSNLQGHAPSTERPHQNMQSTNSAPPATHYGSIPIVAQQSTAPTPSLPIVEATGYSIEPSHSHGLTKTVISEEKQNEKKAFSFLRGFSASKRVNPNSDSDLVASEVVPKTAYPAEKGHSDYSIPAFLRRQAN